MISTEFRDLAAAIAEDTGLDIDSAYALAWQQMPELLNDVMMDVRYRPARVVVWDLLTASELAEWTEKVERDCLVDILQCFVLAVAFADAAGKRRNRHRISAVVTCFKHN